MGKKDVQKVGAATVKIVVGVTLLAAGTVLANKGLKDIGKGLLNG